MYQLAIFKGERYKWSAKRDSEHPDFTLYLDDGEILVSIERTSAVDKH